MITRSFGLCAIMALSAGCLFPDEARDDLHDGAVDRLVSTQTYLTLDGYQNGTPGVASVSGNVFRGVAARRPTAR